MLLGKRKVCIGELQVRDAAIKNPARGGVVEDDRGSDQIVCCAEKEGLRCGWLVRQATTEHAGCPWVFSTPCVKASLKFLWISNGFFLSHAGDSKRIRHSPIGCFEIGVVDLSEHD